MVTNKLLHSQAYYQYFTIEKHTWWLLHWPNLF